MLRHASLALVGLVTFASLLIVLFACGERSDSPDVKVGSAAFSDYRSQQPGTFRKITVADLPPAFCYSVCRQWTEACSTATGRVAQGAGWLSG